MLLAALFHATVLMDLENVPDRFLLGRVDERARVHDDDIGLFRFGNDRHAGFMQVADHDLAIDEIFRAAERDETDLNHETRTENVAAETGRGGKKTRKKAANNRGIVERKTAPRCRGRHKEERWRGSLLLLRSDFGAGFLALQVGGAAFPFDVFVELLAHGVGREKRVMFHSASLESSAVAGG